MDCSACGAALSSEANFCPECGQPRGALRCPSCSASVEDAQRFCAHCGTALNTRLAAAATDLGAGARAAASEPPAPTAKAEDLSLAGPTQRRVCSVLFCDLVGFTSLAESCDPEDVRSILSQYFEATRVVVERYGGSLEKFIGDAVVAAWGIPTAVEGEAERAVRAALDVVDAIADLATRTNAALAVRVSVVTGEVAVTVGARDQSMIAGDAVNTAARVQTIAHPGEVLVDENTFRVAQTGIQFSEAGEHLLRGKSEPTPLWRADRVHSGVGGALRVEGFEAPFVGRDAELRTVKELFHACAERQSPRLVTVTGVAGVGKSRLGWEFEKYLDGLAAPVWWHRGRSLSYGEGVAFWALVEILRSRFGITENETADTAGDKLTRGLEMWIDDEADREYVHPRLARLLGVPTDQLGPSVAREELFAGWRLFFEHLARQGPLVLVFDDLHNVDAGLLDFLEHLLDWSRQVPIFVLALARPELEAARPGWGVRRNGTTLTLEPLDPAAMAGLFDGLVPGMSDAAKRTIGAHAQGIPLYAVETVRMLIDRHAVVQNGDVYQLIGEIGELSVPPTLQSLLAARLDALDETTNRLVADAAVLGESFLPDSLVAVSGLPEAEVRRNLDELVRRQILSVRADPLSPERGQYEFLQTMFRQVAYKTLSRQARKDRHLSVAAHLEQIYASTVDEIAEVVAQHLLDAMLSVPDAPDVAELHDRAVEMLVRSGERAIRTGAPATAAAVFAKVADLLDSPDADTVQESALMHERAGEAAGAAGDPEAAVEHFMAATGIYRHLGLKREAARADAWVGEQLRRQGRYDEAREKMRLAVSILEADPDADYVTALEHLAMLEIIAGSAEGDKLSTLALTLAEALGLGDAVLAQMFITRGIRYMTGGLVQGSASLREGVRRAEAAQDSAATCRALSNLAEVLLQTNPYEAVQSARSAVGHGRRVGDRYMLAFAVATLVEALLLVGDWQEAESVYDSAITDDGLEGDPLVAYAGVILRGLQGDVPGTMAILPVVEKWSGSEDPQDRTFLATSRAVTALCAGDPDSALEQARCGLTNCEALGLITARWLWPTAVAAAFESGDLAAVDYLLDWLDRFPIGYISPLLRPQRIGFAAKRLAAQGDAGATAQFETAVRVVRDTGVPHFLAVTLLDAAENLAGNDEKEIAQAYAEEARVIATQLGSRPLLSRAAEFALHATDSPVGSRLGDELQAVRST